MTWLTALRLPATLPEPTRAARRLEDAAKARHGSHRAADHQSRYSDAKSLQKSSYNDCGVVGLRQGRDGGAEYRAGREARYARERHVALVLHRVRRRNLVRLLRWDLLPAGAERLRGGRAADRRHGHERAERRDD